MTTPAGDITLGDVRQELGIGAGADISLGDNLVRILAGKQFGDVSLGDLKNKTYIKLLAAALGGSVYGYKGFFHRPGTVFGGTLAPEFAGSHLLFGISADAARRLTISVGSAAFPFTSIRVDFRTFMVANATVIEEVPLPEGNSMFEIRFSEDIEPFTAGQSYALSFTP